MGFNFSGLGIRGMKFKGWKIFIKTNTGCVKTILQQSVPNVEEKMRKLLITKMDQNGVWENYFIIIQSIHGVYVSPFQMGFTLSINHLNMYYIQI